jgi:hypothetical protein
MKTRTIRTIIVIFLLLPLFQPIFFPSFGSESYRAHERNEAFTAYERNPSPATKEVLSEELEQLNHYRAVRLFKIVGVLLVIDFAAVYLFWNCGTKKTAI